MSHVNLQLLAKELKLSIGTVSKALRDSHEISPETKKMVLDLAQKLHYTPNPYASSLRRKKSNTIAVIVPEVADSFFSLAIRGIEEIAQSKGYHVLIYLTYESLQKEEKILDECKNGRVDGVLISVSSETNSVTHLQDLSNYNIPIVFFDRTLASIKATKVSTNDFESAFTATNHLLQQGCRHIVYLSISDRLEMNNNRISGFQKAIEEQHNLALQHQVVECSNDAAESEAVITHLLTGPNAPDGILASVEKLAIPVYAACEQHQIRIPDDLKVICFSNTAYAQVLKPSLTTITQPATEMGKTAATLLFKMLKKNPSQVYVESCMLPSELQVRASTAIS